MNFAPDHLKTLKEIEQETMADLVEVLHKKGLENTMSHTMRTLLDDFSELPAHVEPPPTFMEIAGYPHYENVCSYFLADFLDQAKPHALGTLVLDALTSVGSITTTHEGVGGNVSVERQVHTDAGNRIDILLESDTHAILIEKTKFLRV
jgi:hypothetical protein